jgi:uncharacterized protein
VLLDVNVLLALAWPNHQHHQVATRWFERVRRKGWATCAITELGFVRISSNPSFTEEAKSPLEASQLLQKLCQVTKHRFLSCESPPSELLAAWRQTLGHRQTTDVYLAVIASNHGMKLATFDRPISKHPHVNESILWIPGV